MLSFERLDALRKQNKELLTKLQLQTESLKLACPGERAETADSSVSAAGNVDGSSSVKGKKRDRGPLTGRNGDLFNISDLVVNTMAMSEKRPHVAREALCKPMTGTKRTEVSGERPNYFGDEAFRPAEHITEQSQSSEDTTYTRLLQDQGNSRLHQQIVTGDWMQQKPILLPHDRDRRGLDKVSFQSPGQELETTAERRHMQPLLGYDWIAGLLDAESSLAERSEQFFSELRSFRQVNKDECIHSQSSGLPLVTDLWSSSAEEDTDQEHTPDTHQCTFCYRINSRLFATPLDTPAACPICKMPKVIHPHTEKEPAFIRVSIPRSTLLPAYRYKAHRRCSFDPTDSLGLPSVSLHWKYIYRHTTKHTLFVWMVELQPENRLPDEQSRS
ncbi:migration and invasion-inhibitory protein isoform X2 [Colossoma macropomum]|uniref:migration and invasion-inhibitory protein isoform X2 n=1 Tax=Colossoma macropomum TaxID=42526 RepID=UPI001864AA1C|nr:migration and invasion-inhibitory protein isoform X2 [Colossoma macropomum]